MERKKEMVRLEKHVVYYGLFFTTTVGASLLYSQYFGKSDEEKAAFLVCIQILVENSNMFIVSSRRKE
jgi:hypothetical protein